MTSELATPLNDPSCAEIMPVLEIRPAGGWLELDLREIWQRRELLYFLIWRELKVRYKQTAVGVAWVLIQPLGTMLIFTVFFGHLAKIPSGGMPYPLFYYSALLPWTYFASALTNSANSMLEHERVITKVYFPRILLPLSGVLSGLVDFGVSSVLLAGLLAYYHVVPKLSILLAPLLLLLVIATAFGIGLWLSALNAVYRDVRYVIPFALQLWLFASPVAYPSALIPQRYRWIYGINPMAGVIEGFRWALTGAGGAPSAMIFVSGSIVMIVVLTGFIYFGKMEATIADRI